MLGGGGGGGGGCEMNDFESCTNDNDILQTTCNKTWS